MEIYQGFNSTTSSLTTSDPQTILGHVQIPLEDPRKGLLELLIGQSVAKRIHRAVGVAEEVREHVEVFIDAGRMPAESLDEGQHMVGCPAGHEAAQNERDRAKRFASTILRLGLLPSTHSKDQG